MRRTGYDPNFSAPTRCPECQRMMAITRGKFPPHHRTADAKAREPLCPKSFKLVKER